MNSEKRGMEKGEGRRRQENGARRTERHRDKTEILSFRSEKTQF
jgi:hypothetical protein